MAQLRPRWRVALGGAQLDPAMPVAELSVENVVKLCNALERLRGTSRNIEERRKVAQFLGKFQDDLRLVCVFLGDFGHLDQI